MWTVPKIARTVMLIGCTIGSPCRAAAQDNPFSQHTRYMYAGTKLMLVRAAEKMPAEHYGFKPTEAVRSFGEIIGHAADSQYTFCAPVLGEPMRAPNIEKTKTSKADLIAALKEAVAYCDRAYDTITDATGAQLLKLGHEMPKLGWLNVNNLHNTVHYGNLVTYLRIKNIVPPTSEPGFTVEPPRR